MIRRELGGKKRRGGVEGVDPSRRENASPFQYKIGVEGKDRL